MQRKKYALLSAALPMLLLLAGCGQMVSAAESSAAEGELLAAETVYGKIKEINGNEMLLALIEDPTANDRQGGPPAGDGEMDDGGFPDGDFPSDSQPPDFGGGSAGERPATGEGGGQGGPPDMDSGGPGGDTSGGGRQGGGNRGEMGGGPGAMAGGAGQSSVTLTGEERTYLIPITATVTTGQGESARTIRFTQLAVKNVVAVRLDEQSQIIAVEVLG